MISRTPVSTPSMSGDNDDKLGEEVSVDKKGVIFRIRCEWNTGYGEQWVI